MLVLEESRLKRGKRPLPCLYRISYLLHLLRYQQCSESVRIDGLLRPGFVSVSMLELNSAQSIARLRESRLCICLGRLLGTVTESQAGVTKAVAPALKRNSVSFHCQFGLPSLFLFAKLSTWPDLLSFEAARESKCWISVDSWSAGTILSRYQGCVAQIEGFFGISRHVAPAWSFDDPLIQSGHPLGLSESTAVACAIFYWLENLVH